MTTVTISDLKVMRKHAGEAASMLRALSHEARLMVLCELAVGERTAGELVERSGLSQLALSQHLTKLRDEGLVATRRNAQSIVYRISNPNAGRLPGALHEIYCKR